MIEFQAVIPATEAGSLKKQVLSSKSGVCNRLSPLIVSVLYLRSCNRGRAHHLYLQDDTAQSQLRLTLILRQRAEPATHPLSSLHLVTANRVDKVISMKNNLLIFFF